MNEIKSITNNQLNTAQKDKERYMRQVTSFFFIVVAALLFRSFVAEPFRIPSGSMENTLLVGDYVLVSKYSYGYSRHSLPFSIPLFRGTILSKEPKAGDVVVFKPPTMRDTYYVKRIIGVGGDEIQIREGTLYVNNSPIKREMIAKQADDRIQYKEYINQDTSYDILMDAEKEGSTVIDEVLRNSRVYRVPEGSVFLMGDNRDHSRDSRFTDVGYIPKSNIIGKVRLVVISLDMKKLFKDHRFLKKVS